MVGGVWCFGFVCLSVCFACLFAFVSVVLLALLSFCLLAGLLVSLCFLRLFYSPFLRLFACLHLLDSCLLPRPSPGLPEAFTCCLLKGTLDPKVAKR